jgi:hypothetical protein
MMIGSTEIAQASTLNAGYFLNEMSPKEQVAYLSGIEEGLALAYYLRDKPERTGEQCVKDWSRLQTSSMPRIKKLNAFFSKHSKRSVGTLIYALLKKQCGAL